jgi:hypothetical protein
MRQVRRALFFSYHIWSYGDCKSELYTKNDVELVQMVQMRRAHFFQLFKKFRERGLLEDSICTYVEDQVAMFFHVVGHTKWRRMICSTFRMSIEIVSHYFREILHAIGELAISENSSMKLDPRLGSRRACPRGG